MSGIFGIFRFDGVPVAPATLSLMREAMAYYGPDGCGEWQDGPIGIGHLLLRVTPEDSFESQPVKGNGITLVTSARLDNRVDLLRELAVSPSDHATTPDSALVLAAYQRWGDDCPDHLNGDWQFAAWDSQRRSLFIARDHFGNTGLYYYRTAKFFAFASNINALLAIPDVPRRPDMIKMAQVLTSWLGEGWRTAYEDLYRLPPAHTLQVTSSGFETRRYWHPESFPEVRFANDQEYVDQFLDIYTQAVRSRLRSARPIAATLSGGLDSGSVVALASPMLAAEGKGLTAFTSVPLYSVAGISNNQTGNEWDLAAETACMAGNNIDHISLTSEDISLLSAIKHRLEIHNEPGHSASNHFWIEDLQQQAEMRQMGALLTGQFGNFTVSYNGDGSFWNALSTGGISAAGRVLRYCETSPWYAIKRQILKPLHLPVIRFFRHYVKSRGEPWHQYSPIRFELTERIQLDKLMREGGHDPTFTMNPSNHVQQAIFLESSIGARWHEAGAAYGMDVRDPTTDRRIVEFCFRVPEEQYRRRGESRWLIRRAMHGRLPQAILTNKQRGLQAADLAYRVQANRLEIAAILDSLATNELVSSFLDLPRMREILFSFEKNSNIGIANFECSCILLRGLGVGVFCQQFQ